MDGLKIFIDDTAIKHLRNLTIEHVNQKRMNHENSSRASMLSAKKKYPPPSNDTANCIIQKRSIHEYTQSVTSLENKSSNSQNRHNQQFSSSDMSTNS